MAPGLLDLSLLPGFDTGKRVVEHLCAAHQQHDLPDPGNEKRCDVKGIDGGVEKAFQTAEPLACVLLICGHRSGLGVAEQFSKLDIAAVEPQVADKLVRKLQPFGRVTVVIDMGKPIVRVKAVLEPGEKRSLLAEPHKPGKKLAEPGAFQTLQQVVDARPVRRILLERPGVIPGDVDQHPLRCGG